MILPSLQVCFDNQDPSGCWSQGRIIMDNSYSGAQSLVISTYEIASVLSTTISSLGDKHLISYLLPNIQLFIHKLLLTLQYTQESIEYLTPETEVKEPYEGWCTDHKYNLPMIESWTTASVLNYAINLYSVVLSLNRELVLNDFHFNDPSADDWPEWRRWDKFYKNNEPEEKIKVLEYLNNNIVAQSG